MIFWKYNEKEDRDRDRDRDIENQDVDIQKECVSFCSFMALNMVCVPMLCFAWLQRKYLASAYSH